MTEHDPASDLLKFVVAEMTQTAKPAIKDTAELLRRYETWRRRQLETRIA